jgi:type IV pilus assembly protein PilM
MANASIGVTIGSHSLRAVRVRKKGAGWVVEKVFSDRLDDDTRKVAGRALAASGFGGAKAVLGLTGRDVIIRYSQVPPVPDWRLRNLMKFEVEEVGSQSGGDVSADYRKLDLPDPDGTRGEDTILVALARNRYLDERIDALGQGGIVAASACPNSIALFNSFAVNATYTEEETSLLVNIGAEDMDIALQRGGELLFARNATSGGRAFTEAIENAFATTRGKAEQMKLAKADVTPKGQARYPDSTAEKVANAIMGVAGQMSSMIQSTLMIARAQTKIPDLKVDRVLLAGAGASLKGLDLYLKQSMGVPVERFDPFAESDTSGLSDREREMVEKAPHEFTVVMGLAQMALAPAAFRLEVLPAGMRRKREFWSRHVWAAAAGVVALGALFVLHSKLSAASTEGTAQVRRLGRVASTAKTTDTQMRNVLVDAQEQSVKVELLAQLAAPNDLLTRTMAVLEKNLAKEKEVYLHTVRLLVVETENEFPYYAPRRRDQPGTGYDVVTRKRYRDREASVRVSGRISSGQRPAAIYQAFVQACEANDQGLVVRTSGAFRPGNAGQDGSFELEFHPGLPLTLQGEQGASRVIVVRSPALDSADEPTAIVGRKPDGTVLSVPLDQMSAAEAKEAVEWLRSRATPPPAGPQ